MSSSVLSITNAGQVYFFELRPAAEHQMLPVTAVHPVAPEARQSIKTQLDHTIQLLYHFYRAGAPPDELATQPDQLKSLGRLIYGDLLPDVICDSLKQLPLDQPLILSTNDAEFPWELAFDGQQYLGTRWPVGRELKPLSGQQPRQNTPPPRHSWKALFIGNPTGDLPATSDEVEALRDLVEHHLPQAEVYLLGGPGATKQKVRMELASGEYRVIHYSGHAALNRVKDAAFEKDDPAHSGLVLADGEILTAREIQECLDGQPWVFLNACASVQELLAESGHRPEPCPERRSAYGRRVVEGQPVYTGVEAHGLASAFILGGARAVIGTLWPVPDQGAYAFASAVYDDLLAGVSAGEALRRARHTSWRERPLDPIWAAYVLYGPPDLSLVEAKRPERHLATILTARLRGLEVLQERLPLERVAEVADQVITSLAQQVERYGGEVIRAEQDRLTAAFGLRLTRLVAAEVPSDDPAERALHAALALQRTARQVLQTIPGLTGTSATLSTSLPLDVALGLGTGTIVLSRASGSLLGPAAEGAAWLAEQAEPGQILAAETVLRAARDLFVSAPWSNQALATLPAYLELQAVQEVLGPRTEFFEGFLGPLIGREQELQQLTDAWREAQQGRGRIISVIGEAGIGKSRLVHEFSQRLASERCPFDKLRTSPERRSAYGRRVVEGAAQWVMVRCPSRERAGTYALVAALLQRVLELETDGDPTTVRQAIQRGLDGRPAADAGDVSTSTAVLCAALGLLPAEGDPPLPSDPLARRGQLVRSLRQLLAGMMAQRPLVLILEDLHKVDELSAQVLGRLAEGIDQQPLLLLAVYRPDWQPPWSGRRYATSMVLGQLSRDESATLVSSHFQNLLPSEIAEAIADWAGGNPLFVAEVLRTLREGGVLIRRDGAWLLTRPLAEIQIPPSIQGVIQDRVARLSRSTRQMIQAAATLGVEFSSDLLARMLKGVQAPAVIEDNLQNLERRDFLLYDWARAELRFTHDLVQAAVYADMTPEEQRVYHHRAAQAWPGMSPEKKEEAEEAPPLESLAYHLYRSVTKASDGVRRVLVGEVSQTTLERAATSLVAAGDHTRASCANLMARTYYEQAQTIIRALGQGLDRRWVGCFEGLGEAASRLGDFPVASDSLEYAFGMLRRGRMTPDHRRHAADLARRIGRIHATLANTEEALGWMEEGLRTLGVTPGGPETLPDPLDRACAALLHIHTGSTHYLQGDFQAARDACHRGLALAEEAPLTPPKVGGAGGAKTAIAEGCNLLGAILDAQGQGQRALEYYRRSYALYEAMNDRYQLARVGDNIGTALFYLGEWDEAFQWDQKGLTFWRDIDDRDNTAFAAINIGMIYLYRGQWDQAEEHFREGRQLSEEVKNYRILALSHTNLGLLSLAQGEFEQGSRGARERGSRIDEGREHLERSLALLMEHDIEDYLAETYCGLAETAVLAGDGTQALEKGRMALEAARELELPSEESIALRLLGQACQLAGKLEEAEAHLKQSLGVAKGSEIAFEVGRTLVELARLCGETGREADGLAHLDRAVEILERLCAAPMLARARELRTNLAL